MPLADIFVQLDLNPAEFENLRQHYAKQMFVHMRKHLRAFPGVSDTLDRLFRDGFKLIIVTSRGHDSLIPCLEIAGIDPKIFSLLIGREDTREHKPSPAPLFWHRRSWDVVLIRCSMLETRALTSKQPRLRVARRSLLATMRIKL